jgi:quercetin dioxygenase-like cupin family protein
MGPARGGADPHFHSTTSESFYILDGTVRIFDGSARIDAVQGDYVYVPHGGIPAFSNQSGAPAAMLIFFAPEAPREAYFEGLNQLGEMV